MRSRLEYPVSGTAKQIQKLWETCTRSIDAGYLRAKIGINRVRLVRFQMFLPVLLLILEYGKIWNSGSFKKWVILFRAV